ncbi:flagellar hook-basal body complex protein [Brevundimonas balnearis]|uniref:Flagellar hook protein FlgE n=1 Tax=Brevundimonas balnearis TaxID=1572858 RepID=A0ABV6R0E5_9CAUL
MSINSAMLAGVSGLTANSSALAAISQNIANVNTVGYKRSAAEFQTVVNSQTRGTGYSAGGVLATARHYTSQLGQLQRTTSGTDLAIDGQGFFVVTERPEDIGRTDSRLFTRAGAFQIDNLGYLKNSAGLYLQGWPVDADGNVDYDPSDLSRLGSINVGSVGGAAEPTTRVQLNANLMSSQEANPANPAIGTYVAGAMADGTFIPDFEISVPVSDSKGGQRNVIMSLLKSDQPNEWYVEIRSADPADIEPAAANGLIQSGVIAFTPSGRLDTDGMAAAATSASGPGWLFDYAAGDTTISIGASTDTTGVRWASGLGIAAQDISFDLAAAAGGLTQYDSASIVQATLTNGTAFGNLSEIEIDNQGFVTAIFDNGVTRRIAQVAIATFPSPDNLIQQGGNAYQVSQSSGTFNLKTPGAGGAGAIAASQLEASTVDLSSEFTGLITTQRAYSASSKIITTADEMLEELIRIKR